MAKKFVHLQIELKEIKLKENEDVQIKEASKNIEDPRIVTSKTDNYMDPKEKKLKPKDSKPKYSVIKFGAEAQKTCIFKLNLLKLDGVGPVDNRPSTN